MDCERKFDESISLVFMQRFFHFHMVEHEKPSELLTSTERTNQSNDEKVSSFSFIIFSKAKVDN